VAGTPLASSAWHITGSQETSPPRPTWLATQAAATSRTSARAAALALIRAVPACLVSRETDHPARMATSVKIALPTMMARPRLG
jgi:hypothetical protein